VTSYPGNLSMHIRLCTTKSRTWNAYSVNMQQVQSPISYDTLNQFMTKSKTGNVHSVSMQQVPPTTYQNISRLCMKRSKI
jgi:hypothetical protein